MIIGIVGTIGSGKGTVVHYLTEKGFVHYSFSGALREILTNRGESIDRDAYSRVANELRAEDPLGLMKMVCARMEVDHPPHAVLEALHTTGEVEYLRSHGGKILGIDAPLERRYERIISRGSEKDMVSFEEFSEHSLREDEGMDDPHTHNIREALSLVDVLITNDGTLAELHAHIDAALTAFTK